MERIDQTGLAIPIEWNIGRKLEYILRRVGRVGDRDRGRTAHEGLNIRGHQWNGSSDDWTGKRACDGRSGKWSTSASNIPGADRGEILQSGLSCRGSCVVRDGGCNRALESKRENAGCRAPGDRDDLDADCPIAIGLNACRLRGEKIKNDQRTRRKAGRVPRVRLRNHGAARRELEIDCLECAARNGVAGL